MIRYGKTQIEICQDYEDLGQQAAGQVAAKMRELLEKKEALRMVFAAGESQGSFNRAMGQQEGVDWSRVVCFNVDDFWDTRLPREFTCGYQTEQELYIHIPFRTV